MNPKTCKHCPCFTPGESAVDIEFSYVCDVMGAPRYLWVNPEEYSCHVGRKIMEEEEQRKEMDRLMEESRIRCENYYNSHRE